MALMHSLAVLLAFAASSCIAAPTTTTTDTSATPPKVLAHHPILTGSDGKTAIQGPDGLYISHNSTHMAYCGQTNASVADDVVPRSSNTPLETRDGCSTSCTGQYTNGADITTAQAGLRAHFASYPGWSGKSIVFVSASAYAFGCDYGGSQNTPPTQYDVDCDCVANSCGPSQGGWNSRKSWKASYGREIGGYSC